MRKGILLLLLTFFFGILQSVGQDLTFKRITTSNGLSNSWVRCFYQDNTGFIWIGTSDGLNRYDGIRMKVYRPQTNLNFSLGNVTINDIIQKNDSLLWVGTDVGLYTFNMLSQELILDTLLTPHPVICITKDQTNTFWFGTNHGLIVYEPLLQKKTMFTENPQNRHSISNDYINRIKIDSNNKIWIGTKNGLNLYNHTNGNFQRYQNSEEAGSISGNNINCIYEDHQGRIWVGTELNGLNLMVNTSKGFQFQYILSGSITDLYADQKNQLWVSCSAGEGIKIIDLNEFEKNHLVVKSVKSDPLVSTSLSDNSVFRFFEDRFQDLWIGTFGNGVNYYSSRSKLFHNVTETHTKNRSISNSLINAIFDDDDFVWIGTEGGLDRLDKKTGIFKHYQYESSNPASLASNPVMCINKDSRGNLWIGTWAGGLHRYNYKTDSFKRFVPTSHPGSIGSGNIFSIVEDQRHNLWIGTVSGGLNLFNYDNETFKVYKNNPEDEHSLSGRSMNYILCTKNGDLLISEYNVIDKYNYDTDNFEHISRRATADNLAGNITYLMEDSKQNIWLATNTGLELLDSSYNIIKNYTTIEGLPDNTIQAVLEDNSGNLWISTNKGISKFVDGIHAPDNAVFQNFSMADGLPANDFKSRSATKNSNGIMYFGSSNGYTYFHPDSIKLNTTEPTVVFTNFFIQQTSPNEFSTYRSYPKNLNLIKQIDLYYPNTDFIIGFAALNYLNSTENKYQYKLDGYDTDWIAAGNAMTATYTSITEGTYTFMVKGSNNDGYWSPESKNITIVIHPAWWLSLRFKIVVFVLALLISITVIALRFISMRRTNKELEVRVEKRTNELTRLNKLLEEKQIKITEQNYELEQHQNHLEQLVKERTKQLEEARLRAEESDKLKSSFLANMSHEIRTPMNAIIGFSSMLVDKNIPDEKREKYIQQIKNNGSNLNVLINDIIDISIIEAKQMVLSKSQFSVNKILNELFHYFEMENKNKHEFVYLNAKSTRELSMYNDAIRFRQIMVNLLSNAFKYSDKGKIEYGYEFFETEAQFFVSDNGIGIDPSEIENIFKHFYKSNNNKSKLYRGTGIGLAICKSLVTQMGGKIWVESRLNVGSTFYFTLPIIKS